MDDTRPDIAKKVSEMFQEKSPIERLKMGFSMNETSKYLISRSIAENSPLYSAATLRQELFLNFYRNDFDPIARQKIIDYLAPTSEWKEPTTIVLGKECDFEHIPASEKEKKWWKYLYPLIQARLRRGNQERSTLLKVLGRSQGSNTWETIKKMIEVVLSNVKDGERILARTSEIKKSPDPDGIINDMFGELRTVPYLIKKGFTNISYSRRKKLDFKADFGGVVFYIESTYVHGPDFKTQEYMPTSKQERILPIYKIRPDKVIRLFESVYLRKKEQVIRNLITTSHTLIVMVTDLEETYAPWLEHVQIQGKHPIANLISNWEIPTVILGYGSTYEPVTLS